MIVRLTFTGPVTAKVVSSIPDHGEMYTMKRFVIESDSDVLLVFWFPPPINLTTTI